MKNKRNFHRTDAHSASGKLIVGDTHIDVVFENISLAGARVHAHSGGLPGVGTLARLICDDKNYPFNISCTLLALENDEAYRVKFGRIGNESLGNLIGFLRQLGGQDYSPDDELSKLVLKL